MKIALVVIIVGLILLPFQEAVASNTSNLRHTKINTHTFKAAKQSTKQAYKVKSRQQATKMIKKAYRAKVVSVSSATVNGNSGYKAKLLDTNGTVFYVYIDAVSGQMSRR